MKKKSKAVTECISMDEGLIFTNELSFAAAEAYKLLRTNIMFSLSAVDKKIFAVTSHSKGEGKSTVSANLAISFSKMEKRVLLISYMN